MSNPTFNEITKEPILGMGDLGSIIKSQIPDKGNVEEKDDDLDDDKEDEKDDLDDKEKKDDDLDDDSEEEVETKKEPKKEEKKKEEESENNNQEDDSIISVFKEKFGEVAGEFEESMDGVLTYVDKVIESKSDSFRLEGQEELLSKTPELKALKEHLDGGFGLDSFLKQQELIDWDKVSIKDKEGEIDLARAEQIFRHAREIKGIDKEDIDVAWENAKDKGIVEERVEKSIDFLKKEQDKYITDLKAKEKIAFDKQVEDDKKVLDEAEKILKSGKILGVALNSEEIKELRKYSFETDKQGKSERDRRIEALTTEEGLFIDMILKNNFKGLGVKVQTSKASDDMFKKFKEKNKEDKKPDLRSNNTSSKERQNIDVKSLFKQQI